MRKTGSHFFASRAWLRFLLSRMGRLRPLLLVLAAGGAAIGASSTYDGLFPALGGPNGLLYDMTLRVAQPFRRPIPEAPVLFVAIDEATLARPEFAALPRALFQPIFAHLIDGLIQNGAHLIAFDVVLAYQGADFHVESFALPDYDGPLLARLRENRDRIVLGRFPTEPVAPAFLKAAGPSRIGILDLQIESDGRVRSTGTFARLPDGRIAFGFAALAAGLGVEAAASRPRLMITPTAPLEETPTFRLGPLLDCFASGQQQSALKEAIEGRIVVIGTAVLGEDEHRGPTRFLAPSTNKPAGGPCTAQEEAPIDPQAESVAGALLQLAAIQSATSSRPVLLAGVSLRALAGACLALLFALAAIQDESPLIMSERDVSPRTVRFWHLARSTLSGLMGPFVVAGVLSALAFILADLWLPMGYPAAASSLAFVTILGLRFSRHRALYNRLYRTAGRYLPPARLAALARSGFAGTPEGQEREVSILLVDLVGFTQFSNEPNLSVGEVMEMANRYFNLMQSVIDRHSGCSDKFLGDALLAFWNGLSDEPDHAFKALLSAEEILCRIRLEEARPDERRMTARAVVCSGPVYVGDLGAETRKNFTIIGPAVNETFRLEKLPDVYGLALLISGEAAQRIIASCASPRLAGALEGFELVRIDDVRLKGFDRPKPVYALVPCEDPGLASFKAGRQALDENRREEGLAHLKEVRDGRLQKAARLLSQIE